jgi:hypothetical protein
LKALLFLQPIFKYMLPRNTRIEPEQRICIEISNRLKELTLTGKYKGVWFHVANEGKRSRIVACLLKAMGLHSGVSDYVFVWSGGALFAEIKGKGNSPTPNQKIFKKWCEVYNLEYEVFYDCESLLERLIEKNAIIT